MRLTSLIFPMLLLALPQAAVEAGFIYWGEGNSAVPTNFIRRTDLETPGVEDVLQFPPFTGGPREIAIHDAERKIYWAHTTATIDSIRRSNIDGSAAETIVGGINHPWGVTLDLMHKRVYWTERDTGLIKRAALDGSNTETVLSGFDRLRAIDIAADGKIYWADTRFSAPGAIYRSNLDGSGLENVVTGLGNPWGVAVDEEAGKLYWTDLETDKVQRANLDGSSLEDLVTTGLDIPKGIDVVPSIGKMFWADAGTGKIQSANLDGSNATDLLTGLRDVRGVTFTPVPEPNGMVLFLLGAGPLMGYMLWKKRASATSPC